MFKKLSVKNFRGLADLTLSDLKRVNLLVGRNNCGKTSVLEAMFLLSNPGFAGLSVNINNFRQYMMTSENDWALIFGKLNVSNPIDLEADLSVPRELRKVRIRPHMRSGAVTALKGAQPGLVTEQLKDNFSGSEAALNGLDYDFEIAEPGDGKKPQKYSSGIQTAASQTIGIGPNGTPIQVPQILPQVPANYKETLKAVLITPTNLTVGLPLRFGKLQEEKRLDKVLKVLKQVEPSVAALSLSPSGHVLVDIGLSKLIPINMMGDGMVRLLSILLAFSDVPNGVVLVDEIEDGFHHTSQAILWDAIFEAAKDFNAQVVATSHSVECVKAFRNSFQKNLDLDDDIRLFRLEKKNHETKAVPYDKTTLATALESDWEVR